MSTKKTGRWACVERKEDILLFHLGYMNRVLFKRANRYLVNSGYAVRAEQIPLLMAIYMGGAQSQQQLAEETGKDKASVLRTVRSLAGYGYIDIADDPCDGRKHVITLTDAGVELMDKILDIVARVDRMLFSAIGETDKNRLIHIMSKISNRLRD